MSTSTTPEITREQASDRLRDLLEDSLTASDYRLIDALPGLGKSHGVIKAAAQNDVPVTILTGRGWEEQYQQFSDWAKNEGLSCYTFPSPDRTCGTSSGEYGADHAAHVRKLRDRASQPARSTTTWTISPVKRMEAVTTRSPGSSIHRITTSSSDTTSTRTSPKPVRSAL